MYPFSAVRIYDAKHKHSAEPPLDRDHASYGLIHSFVERRIGDAGRFFEEGSLDALILTGGGLFRETARAIRLAAQNAILRGADRIGSEDARHAASQIKKDYQPLIRGNAVKVLSEVWESRQGWVEGVEPFLQWKAVVEYENGDLWLDVRSVLKPYLESLKKGDG